MRRLPETVRRLVKADRLGFSSKADRLMDALGLGPDDAARALLEGHLFKRERDETEEADWKYTVEGPAIDGRKVYCAGKVLSDDDGPYYFVFTAHWARRR